MKKKSIIAGAAVVVLAAVIAVPRIFTGEEIGEYESRPTVEVQKPETGDIVLYTEMIGTIEPASKADVQPKMGGEILEVFFQAGDYVEAGQVLCQIDSDALTSLKLSMDSASIAMSEAQRTLSRTQALYAAGAVSQQQMEQAQDAAESSRIAYESAKNQYDLQVEYTTVTAPISGVVEARSIEPHDHIGTDTVVCTISSDDQYEIQFGISDRTLENLSVGDAIQVDKGGNTYEAHVSEIGTMVNAATGLYDVKAAVPQENGLTTGAKVKLTVVQDQAKDALTIPVDAVSYSASVAYVYCYENGTARRVDVETGIYDEERMEILSGLTADSQVITTWSNELVDGAQVLMKEADAGEETSGEEETQAADGAQEGEDAAETPSAGN